MSRRYVGIDGEGKGRNPHLYTLLAVADESGEYRYIENSKGLSSKGCLQFLVDLSDFSKVFFAYAFLYDITKILEDLPDELIYKLLRPELRLKGKRAFSPIEWEGFKINWIAAKLSIRKEDKRVVIWDIFKFYQSRFVVALKNWKVGTADKLESISDMKDKREGFEHETDESIRNYCISECVHLAELAHKLVDAHDKAGVILKDFYGAGSTAGAILKGLNIDKKKRDAPEQLRGAVMRAFFGGRFENSVIGDIEGPIYNFDISSAYPYQLYRLPCLEHGSWTITNSEEKAKNSSIALVWWRLEANHNDYPWGPFPFRTEKGSILFPVSGGNGFTWKEEFFQARSMFSNVRFVMAYVFQSYCKCRPFADIPSYYRERCRIGKNGPGIVLKLGPNACYGKIAQSVGNPKFNCWTWAGMITSNVRAQILQALSNHNDYSNMCIVATDGIYTKEDIKLPVPEDTGTFDLAKPLGGWEREVISGGMFAARPGINFPLDSSEISIDKVKGRGFGRRALFENAKHIRTSWYCYKDGSKVKLPNISRFYGAKTSIWKVGYLHRRAPEYGTWYEYEPDLSFNPMPKRKEIKENGFLVPHNIPADVMSSPYKGNDTLDHALKFLEDIIEEQPE